MSRVMTRARLLKIAIFLTVTTGLVAVGGYVAWTGLDEKIERRLEHGWVLSPLELYSRGVPITVGRKFPRDEFAREFTTRGLTETRDFGFGEGTACTAPAGLGRAGAPARRMPVGEGAQRGRRLGRDRVHPRRVARRSTDGSRRAVSPGSSPSSSTVNRSCVRALRSATCPSRVCRR